MQVNYLGHPYKVPERFAKFWILGFYLHSGTPKSRKSMQVILEKADNEEEQFADIKHVRSISGIFW
jgi:hypothetical protein